MRLCPLSCQAQWAGHSTDIPPAHEVVVTSVTSAYSSPMAQPVDVPHFDYQALTVVAWRTLRRLGVPESNLPDACQDVLLVLHRRRGDFRGDCSVTTWVYGIVLRVASNYRRTRKRSFALFDRSKNSTDIPVSAKSPSPLEQVEQRAARQLLERILAEMPDNLRSAFVLVELEELDTAEAALLLEVSESTCRSWLQRARKAFNASVTREQLRQARHQGGGL